MKTLIFCVLAILIIPLYGITAQTREFSGLSFGVGLSLTVDIGHHHRVIDASLDESAIVRITSENNCIPRVVLETHYFFADSLSKVGHGPFVAIQPGTDEIINAFGFGYMMGLRKITTDKNGNSLNIGLALMLDPNIKVLGDGIEENKPLPAGETKVRFKNTDQLGILFLVSFTF